MFVSSIFYWTEWGMNSSILMAGMDGKNITLLVNQNLEWPNSLSIDYPNNRLYWIDTKQKVIESIQLDGTDRRVHLIFLNNWKYINKTLNKINERFNLIHNSYFKNDSYTIKFLFSHFIIISLDCIERNSKETIFISCIRK